MIVRVVQIKCKKGKEEQLKQIGRNVIIPVNEESGCINVYFLEPNVEDNNPNFGVISTWKNKETLDSMRNSEKYQSLRSELDPMVESLIDTIYNSH